MHPTTQATGERVPRHFHVLVRVELLRSGSIIDVGTCLILIIHSLNLRVDEQSMYFV